MIESFRTKETASEGRTKKLSSEKLHFLCLSSTHVESLKQEK
jgi:hypothetical protein